MSVSGLLTKDGVAEPYWLRMLLLSDVVVVPLNLLLLPMLILLSVKLLVLLVSLLSVCCRFFFATPDNVHCY